MRNTRLQPRRIAPTQKILHHYVTKHIWWLRLSVKNWPRCCCTSSACAAADALNFKPALRGTEFSRWSSSKSGAMSNLYLHTWLRAFVSFLHLPPSTWNRRPRVGVDLSACTWAHRPVFDTCAHLLSHTNFESQTGIQMSCGLSPASALQIYLWTLWCSVM